MTRWLLLGVAAVGVGVTLWLISDVHEVHRRADQACRETLAKELRWKPWAQMWVLPADPCEAIRTVRMGRGKNP